MAPPRPKRIREDLPPALLPLLPGFSPADFSSDSVKGLVQAVLHADASGGFEILRVEAEDGGEFIVAGKGDAVSLGDEISAQGAWEVDPRWGRRFKARYIRAGVPDSADGIVRFISCGNVSGVGASAAKKLLAAFGDRLPELMDSPATLAAAGIPEAKARRIGDAWRMRSRHGRLLTLLYAHGLGPATASRIVDHYGEDTMRVVLGDPYRLSKDIRGVGFKTADRIALSQSKPKDAPERVAAALRHQLEQFGRSGHCAAGRSMLVGEASKLVLLQPDLVESHVERLLIQGELVEESVAGRTAIYDKPVRECEMEVAALLASRLESNPVPDSVRGFIDAVRLRLGLPELHEGQAAAVELGLRSSTCVVTGNPGTGKTSTVSVLIGCLLELLPTAKISLAAPTGRAAQRLAESTGYPASTLHRLLEWAPESRGFTKGLEDTLELDVLVVDESSMLDIWLARDLLRALPPHARLVVVGDVDQLPSVGAGNVLSDVISSGVVPVARLTHIFRQGAGSAIAEAAQKINSGVMPRTHAFGSASDMWGEFVEEPAQIPPRLEILVKEHLPRLGMDPLRDLQVLAPGHQGESGTVNLNKLLQSWLNPPRPGESVLVHKEREFRPRDRVIQISNDYDREVFNGDIGHVLSVGSPDPDGLVVSFEGREVVYERSELDQLQHAYCISIHKSQGSEFPAVVTVVSTQHWIMLQRNLVYTGVSRARRLCCLLGQKRALSQAVRHAGALRLTGLAQRLSAASTSPSAPDSPLAPPPKTSSPAESAVSAGASADAPSGTSPPPADPPLVSSLSTSSSSSFPHPAERPPSPAPRGIPGAPYGAPPDDDGGEFL